jgi:hypothetical protein
MFRSRLVLAVLAVITALALVPQTTFAAKSTVKAPASFSAGYVDVFGGGTGFLSGWAYDNGKPVSIMVTFVDVNDATNTLVLTSTLNNDRPDVTSYLQQKTKSEIAGTFGFMLANIAPAKPGYFKLQSAYFNGNPMIVGSAAQPTLDLGFDHQLYASVSAEEMGYDREVPQGEPLAIYWYDTNVTAATAPQYVITLLNSETREYVGQIARIAETFTESEGKTLSWDGATVTGQDGQAVVVVPGSYVIQISKMEPGFNNVATTEVFTMVTPEVYAVLQRDIQRAIGVIGLQYALALYYDDNGRYPDAARLESALVPTYLTALPVAPTPADGSCTVNQNQIIYAATTFGESYSISFCLGVAHDDTAAGLHTVTPADFAALGEE